jgi:hypothetical protein
MNSATEGDDLTVQDTGTAAVSPLKGQAATTTNEGEPDDSKAEAASRAPLGEGQHPVFQKGDLVRVSPRYVRLFYSCLLVGAVPHPPFLTCLRFLSFLTQRRGRPVQVARSTRCPGARRGRP